MVNSSKLGAFNINGVRFGVINGVKWSVINGVKFGTGYNINGTRLDSVTIDGADYTDFQVEGSTLVGTVLQNGEEVELSGTEMIGTVFGLTIASVDEEGNDVEVQAEIRIDDVYPDPNAYDDDVMAYQLSTREVGGEWSSPCLDFGGEAQPAIVLSNYWDTETGDRIDDPTVFTFACTTGVLAHCTEWGYRPWAEAELCKNGKKGKKGKKCETVQLTDHHQACTRMARADYCGNGEPWTVDGTHLDIWDNLSPQIQERAFDWVVEAEWTPDGAYCLNDIRQQGWKAEGLYPSCGKKWDKHNKTVKNCGSLKKNRALLVSSFEP
ncbi:MAG: hypothetical protein H6711_07510 [Myxococcales bacterium]|nr:hypothetical protein [Myxococcales bacterium]